MKRNWTILLATAIFLPVMGGMAADFSACKETYQKASDEIRSDYQPKFAGLQQQYRQALETLRVKVQNEGDLDKTKAALAEIARFEKAKSLPSAQNGGEIPEIKTLQDAYVKQFGAWEQEMGAKLGSLAAKYMQALEQLQKDLVRAGKLDEATTVRTERRRVQSLASGSQESSVNPVGVTGSVEADRPVSPTEQPADAAAARERQLACAKHLGLPVEIVNSIGMRFVLVPPGEFDMGSSPAVCQAESGRKPPQVESFYASRIGAEGPSHRIKISKPFYLSTCEVTQNEYEQIMQANPSQFSSTARGREGRRVAGMDTRRFPVENVLWDEAGAFAKTLAALPAERQARRDYRLPTEAEWEYGCRADTSSLWCCGDDVAGLFEYAWFRSNSDDRTHPVGEKQANAWGLCDMQGNVFEWCSDHYTSNYYGSAESLVDPQGPSEGPYRSVRGGAYNRYPYACRSAYRAIGAAPPLPVRASYIGFRICFSAER